jgi:hypothetical protein
VIADQQRCEAERRRCHQRHPAVGEAPGDVVEQPARPHDHQRRYDLRDAVADTENPEEERQERLEERRMNVDPVDEGPLSREQRERVIEVDGVLGPQIGMDEAGDSRHHQDDCEGCRWGPGIPGETGVAIRRLAGHGQSRRTLLNVSQTAQALLDPRGERDGFGQPPSGKARDCLAAERVEQRGVGRGDILPGRQQVVLLRRIATPCPRSRTLRTYLSSSVRTPTRTRSPPSSNFQ